MKRKVSAWAGLLALATVTVSSPVAVGQEALWDKVEAVSPHINHDGSVTFSLVAPQARCVSVQGDFLQEGEKGVMERNAEGVWQLTTSRALPGELYSYSFLVDSLRILDPSNVHLNRDIATLSNYFIIPEGHGELYSVNDVPHGTVNRVWYESKTAGKSRRLTVYTPAGYEENPDRRYPVLYLLHGSGGDENAWTELGRSAQILDNLVARGEAQPMIVVMPNGNIDAQAAPGEGPEGLIVPTARYPHSMDGTFERSFPEIVSYVDSTYRTIPEKDSRAIAGLSMGGFHSLHISKEYPDDYGYVGLFSTAVKPLRNPGSPFYSGLEEKLARQFASAPRLYWIGIGRDDFLYDINVDFRQTLDAAGYPYTYRESEGGHTWRNWRVYLSEFLPLLFK